jgi:hypothetical protein
MKKKLGKLKVRRWTDTLKGSPRRPPPVIERYIPDLKPWFIPTRNPPEQRPVTGDKLARFIALKRQIKPLPDQERDKEKKRPTFINYRGAIHGNVEEKRKKWKKKKIPYYEQPKTTKAKIEKEFRRNDGVWYIKSNEFDCSNT